MQTFKVTKDQLVKVWSRITYYIEAETKEEALALAKETDDVDDFEYLSDTEEYIEPVKWKHTEEWIIDDEVIETNEPL